MIWAPEALYFVFLKNHEGTKRNLSPSSVFGMKFCKEKGLCSALDVLIEDKNEVFESGSRRTFSKSANTKPLRFL